MPWNLSTRTILLVVPLYACGLTTHPPDSSRPDDADSNWSDPWSTSDSVWTDTSSSDTHDTSSTDTSSTEPDTTDTEVRDTGDSTPTSGWTDFAASADTVVVYVSESEGSDDDDGLSPEHPVQTLAHAESLLRHGFPDWLLLKRGDVWRESLDLKHGGRSETERLLISAYGEGERPRIETSSIESAITIMGGGAAPDEVSHVAIVGLHLYASARDPGSPDFEEAGAYQNQGVVYMRPGEDLLIEDCRISFFHVNLVIMGEGDGLRNFQLRRSVIEDAYSTVGHSQGIYLDSVHGIVLEENVFDRNGWNEAQDAPLTIFNHHVYIQDSCSDATVRGNIFARADGVQIRTGGTAEDNLFLQIAIGLGAFNEGTTTAPVLTRNVFIEGMDMNDGADPRGYPIWIGTSALPITVTDNLIAHQGAAGAPNAFNSLHDAQAEVLISANTIVDWASEDYEPYASDLVKIEDNLVWGSAFGSNVDARKVEFVDDERTAATYHASLGGTATLEAFLDQARAQERSTWDVRYQAAEVNDYLREGYTPR